MGFFTWQCPQSSQYYISQLMFTLSSLLSRRVYHLYDKFFERPDIISQLSLQNYSRYVFHVCYNTICGINVCVLICSQAIRDSDYSDKIKESDIDQATSFLHDSGILLHYEDSSLLNDLYFINPQWLCSMLAKLITIKENNPFQRQGECVRMSLGFINT